MASSSSPRSVFDVLMSSASTSAAANKKKNNKRKTPYNTLHAYLKPMTQLPSNILQSDTNKQCDDETVIEGDKKLLDVTKKAKVEVSVMKDDDKMTELKIRINQLKNNPSDFDPKSVATWNNGESVPFLFLSLVFDMLSLETRPSLITGIVCNMLRTVVQTTPDDCVRVVYLCAGRIARADKGVELGIGGNLIKKALAEAFGCNELRIEGRDKELGDLGLVAKECRSSQTMMCKPIPLTVAKVFNTFWCIAKESGKKCHEKKKNHIKSLVVAATDCEPQYLIRLLQTNLRNGLAEETLLTALGYAAVYFEKHSKPPPHIKSPLEEIHYMENGSVEIYSRNAKRSTGKYPDAIVAVSRLKKPSVTSFILDCEIVAIDREKKEFLRFQDLSTRGRNDVDLRDIKIEVCIFAFDILYLNGQPLIQEQLKVRREHLYNSFEEDAGYFQFATAINSTDIEEIENFLEVSVDSRCEGLVIKTLDREATYEPSKRSNNWLKLKKDYMDSIGDSLDLVPIAAFHGRGNRTGGYGSFVLACYDSNNNQFQSICKTGSGFARAKLKELSASLLTKVITKPTSTYRHGNATKPDVWFEPTEVWEVRAADLTVSPVYQAAVGKVQEHPQKGISLRFPRLERVRKDKTPELATTSEQIAEMYRAQRNVKTRTIKSKDANNFGKK